MSSALGPVDPRHASVRSPAPELDVDERRDIVFVGVTGMLAVLGKQRKEGLIGDDLQGELPVHLEPLRALPPLFGLDGRAEEVGVAAAAAWTRIVVDVYEGVHRVDEVVVDGCEWEEGNASLRQQHETFVAKIKQRVCQKPPLCFQ